MSRLLLVVMTTVVFSGCLVNRRATFSTVPSPLPYTNGLQAAPLQRTWAIGEIVVTGQQPANAPTDHWSTAEQQIAERLKETLRRQPIPGQRTDDRQSAELIVDVDVRVNDVRGVNTWAVPAYLSVYAVLAAGAGAGAAIGVATGGDDDPVHFGLGSIIGGGLAVVPALLVASLFPVNDVVGNAEARLTFRRASDGVGIFERKTRAEWVVRHDSFSVENDLAAITGAGIESLEKELVVALYTGLQSSPPVQHVEAVREDSATIIASDAPRRLLSPR